VFSPLNLEAWQMLALPVVTSTSLVFLSFPARVHPIDRTQIHKEQFSTTYFFENSLVMTARVENSYQLLPGEEVTEDMLGKAARLFNENYGVSDPSSHRPGK
jgi:hypothetical protein